MKAIGQKWEPRICESISILDSEEMTDKAYQGLIAMIDLIEPKNGSEFVSFFETGGCLPSGGVRRIKHINRNDSVVSTIFDGIYIPGTTRCYLKGEVDIKNDVLPLEGSVIIDDADCIFSWVHIKKRPLLSDRDVIYPIPKKEIHTLYVANTVQMYKDSSDPYVHTSYTAIDRNGFLYPIHSRHQLRNSPLIEVKNTQFSGFHWVPGAISLLADRSYLWLVETEELVTEHRSAKVQFGVDPEMVKSLLYARQGPLTETGRKKPILHWVRAHQRRINAGIDVDIRKHLRGNERIEMGSLNFTIVQPKKIPLVKGKPSPYEGLLV